MRCPSVAANRGAISARRKNLADAMWGFDIY